MKLNMRALRERTLSLLDSLWQAQFEGGGHAGRPGEYVSVMGTSDAAWIYHMLNAEDKKALYGADACRWLLSRRRPDGSLSHDIPRKGEAGYRHSDGHAFWMSARAVGIYGGELDEFPACLEDCLTPEGLEAWFSRTDWASSQSNHHNVLGLLPLLASHPNSEWRKTFARCLSAQQDCETACWCDNREHRPNVSRTLAYCCLYGALGLPPPDAGRLVETVLKLQRPEGIWERRVDFPEFHTMDAVYIVSRIGDAIDYPAAPRLDALNRTAEAMNVFFANVPVAECRNTHDLEANLHTVGLLQEALPERYDTDQPWRFDWDKSDAFYSQAIADYAAKRGYGKETMTL